MGVHGLTGNEHGTLGMKKHAAHTGQRDVGGIGFCTLNLPFVRQNWYSIVEQRFADGHVDVDRPMLLYQRLVDQTVAVPTLLIVVRFWQRDGLTDKAS